MALSIKNPEAEQLARAVANATGESITLAITRALEERLARLSAGRELDAYARGVHRIQKRLRERPVLDARSADELLGFGTDGVPQ